jgi:hypothetical protein
MKPLPNPAAWKDGFPQQASHLFGQQRFETVDIPYRLFRSSLQGSCPAHMPIVKATALNGGTLTLLVPTLAAFGA